MGTPDRIKKYQNTIISRACKNCGNETNLKRRLKPYCNRNCLLEFKRKLRPQTFNICVQCNQRFGPVSHLKTRFCSYRCKSLAQSTGRKLKTITKPIARNAQSLIRYYINKGKIIRPDLCEFCRNHGRIEAAHKDYSKPLDVFWLCRSCHIKYDKKNPKYATYSVPLYTGKDQIKINGELVRWDTGEVPSEHE